MKTHHQILSAVLAVSLSSTLSLAQSTWNGTTDNNWSTASNWSAGVPTGSSTAPIFNNSGNGNTTIITPPTLPNVNFNFLTANVAAYTIGSTSSNITAVGNGFSVAVDVSGSSVVTTSQVFNPTLSLGIRGDPATPAVPVGPGSINLVNHSVVVGQTLTVNSPIVSTSSPSQSGWTINFRGNGVKLYNGTITQTAGGPVLSVSLGGGGTNTGTTTLSNANAYTGGTAIGGGASGLVLGNKDALGSGALTINANAGAATRVAANTALTGANAVANSINYISSYGLTDFNGSSNLEFSGPVNLNSAGLGFNGAQTFQVSGSQRVTFSGIVGGNGTNQAGLVKSGTGVLELTGANTFGGTAQGVNVNAGTLLINNTAGSGTGTSGQMTINNTGTLGGSGTVSSLIAVTTGGSFRPGAALGTSTAVFSSTSIGTSALVLNTGSTTVFDVNGTTKGTEYDNFTTAGRVNYGGDFTINLSSVVADATTNYDLFSFATPTDQAGTFNSITLAGAYSGALTNTEGVWSGTFGTDTVTFTQSTGDLTVVAAVPEPASLALIAGGLALLGGRRRKA